MCFVLIIYLHPDLKNTNFARRRAISRRCAIPADTRREKQRKKRNAKFIRAQQNEIGYPRVNK